VSGHRRIESIGAAQPRRQSLCDFRLDENIRGKPNMRWSWKIANILGIGVYVHATFWLLILFILYSSWSQGNTIAQAAAGVVFVLSIFACVVLHEFGHALTARRFGIRTRDITLLPIGGVARLE